MSVAFDTPTGNLFFVVGILAVALVVFHFAFLYLRPLSERGAKLIDYWWLSLTAIGLITAAGEARQLVAPLNREVARLRASAARDWLRTVAEYPYHCQTFGPTDYNQDRLAEARMKEAAGCAWAKSVAALVQPNQDIDAQAAKGVALPPLPKTLSVRDEDVRDVIEASASLDAELARLRTAIQMIERSETERTVKLLWPALLAVALALRITKVTVELRLLHEKQNPG